jgi:hypothetical protein
LVVSAFKDLPAIQGFPWSRKATVTGNCSQQPGKVLLVCSPIHPVLLSLLLLLLLLTLFMFRSFSCG